MKDLGHVEIMLVIEIARDRTNKKMFILQPEYTDEILKRFRMQNTRTVSTPILRQLTYSSMLKTIKLPKT